MTSTSDAHLHKTRHNLLLAGTLSELRYQLWPSEHSIYYSSRVLTIGWVCVRVWLGRPAKDCDGGKDMMMFAHPRLGRALTGASACFVGYQSVLLGIRLSRG